MTTDDRCGSLRKEAIGSSLGIHQSLACSLGLWLTIASESDRLAPMNVASCFIILMVRKEAFLDGGSSDVMGHDSFLAFLVSYEAAQGDSVVIH